MLKAFSDYFFSLSWAWFCSIYKIESYFVNISKVLGQLPPRKIAPNPKINPNPNPNSNQGTIFLRGNCLLSPNPKTNPDLDGNPISKY